jgi:hypothetical protein
MSSDTPNAIIQNLSYPNVKVTTFEVHPKGFSILYPSDLIISKDH